jgi:uncharacterized protein (TIGR00251 family)
MLFIPLLDMLPLQKAGLGVYLFVKISPGASKTALGKIEHIQKKNVLKIYIKAVAVDGQANKALIDFIAENFYIKKSSISITSGLTQRFKTIFIDNTQIDHIALKIYPV